MILAVTVMMGSCASHYHLQGVSRSRIVVDSRYDRQPDEAAAAFLAPYTEKVTTTMGAVVGRVAHDMEAKRPESDLSNLLSDILLWASKGYGEEPAFAVYNQGGIRAPLLHGDVTYGDVLDIAPFENKICFLTLTGSEVLELFENMAKRGGEGVSRGVAIVITKDGHLVKAKVNGEPVDPAKNYRIATIDYLAQGNDGMTAFKKAKNLVAPHEEHNNTRYIIIDYFKEQAAKGIEVTAKVEGRIVVSEK